MVWWISIRTVEASFALLPLYKSNSYRMFTHSIQILYKFCFKLLSARMTSHHTNLASKNYDSCPFWSHFALYSLSHRIPDTRFFGPVWSALKLRRVKFLNFHLVNSSIWPLLLTLAILLSLISWQSKVYEVEASLSVCIHDSKSCVIIIDNYQG